MSNNPSTLWYERAKDTPGKLWWDASAMHPAIFRALKVSKDDPGAIYAAHPFRLAQIDERHVIIAAWPAPSLFGDPDPDWLDIETVIAWDPVANYAEIIGDDAPQLVGAFQSTEQGTIYGQPFAFFRHWLEQRAAFATAYQMARAAHFTASPTEIDTPGMLLIGDPDKARWSGMPTRLHCVGIEPAKVNKAILKQARLPRAVGGMKAAA